MNKKRGCHGKSNHRWKNVRIDRLLQDASESHGVLQSELCETTGLTKNHISAVKRGVSKANIRMLHGCCEKIGITPNVFKYIFEAYNKTILHPCIIQDYRIFAIDHDSYF